MVFDSRSLFLLETRTCNRCSIIFKCVNVELVGRNDIYCAECTIEMMMTQFRAVYIDSPTPVALDFAWQQEGF